MHLTYWTEILGLKTYLNYIFEKNTVNILVRCFSKLKLLLSVFKKTVF